MRDHITALIVKYPGRFDNLSTVNLENTDDVNAIAYDPSTDTVLYNTAFVKDELVEGCLAFISKIIAGEYHAKRSAISEDDYMTYNISVHEYIIAQLSEFEFSEHTLPPYVDPTGKTVDQIFEEIKEIRENEKSECDTV